ncbi:MAG: nicotinate-nucleotide adenylyltransferase [Chloroflexota bacterium]
MDVKPRIVGAMGGTFDPPHYGHLVGAQEACALLGLDHVLFVPTGQPPHKLGEPVSSVEHRVRMTELAIGENSSFRLSRADLDQRGPSYTVQLIPRLLQEIGAGVEIVFLIGMDSLRDLASWREPEAILKQCRLVAFSRPNYQPVNLDELEQAVPGARDRVIILRTPGVDISSTELRGRVIRHLPIRYLVPPGVESYIREHELYLSAPTPPRRPRAPKKLKADAF